METNYVVIGLVVLGAIALVVYLIRRNNKDEKEVTNFFNKEQSNFHDEESEMNDER